MDRPKLTHYRLCPKSRSIRLALREYGIDCEMAEHNPWEWPREFLDLNPAGDLPVLQVAGGAVLCSVTAIAEFIAEAFGAATPSARHPELFPGSATDRAEVRRITDWFCQKFHNEVAHDLLNEKVYQRLRGPDGAAPDIDILRAARAALRYHLSYLCHLAEQRHWLAGDAMSFADLMAAAQISTADYLGEIAWADFPVAKDWYQRIKSRPSFRTLLGDRIAGMSPAADYADIDF